MSEKRFNTKEEFIVECIENATKLMKEPNEANCLKAIRILEEVEKSRYADLSVTNRMKKGAIILYMTLLETKGLEYYKNKQYSQGVKLLDRIGELILHHSKDLDIDKQVMISFLNEFINDIQLTGLETITLASETHKNLKEKAYKRAAQAFGNKVETRVLQILIDCLIMSETIRQTYKIE